MLVYAVTNHKGGVGKTTTTANLGAAFAQAGRRVLLVDLDPQGCLTASVGVTPDRLSIGDVLCDPSRLAQTIVPCASGMSLAPAKATLAVTLLELAWMPGTTFRLAQALQSIQEMFDTVLIDCPSSIGVAMTNALAAAHIALVPMQCDFLSLRGLTDIQAITAAIQEAINPGLRLRAVATSYDRRINHGKDILNEAREALPGLVYGMVIPRSVRLAEAPATGQTILEFAPRSQAADSYRALAREIMQEETNHGTTRRHPFSHSEIALRLQAA